MTEKEILKNLIDNAKQPNVTEWVFNVETFLRDTKEGVKETSGSNILSQDSLYYWADRQHISCVDTAFNVVWQTEFPRTEI